MVVDKIVFGSCFVKIDQEQKVFPLVVGIIAQ